MVHAGYHQIFLLPLESQPIFGEHVGGVLVGVACESRALILLTGCADGPVSIELRALTQEIAVDSTGYDVAEAASLIIDEPLNMFGPTAEAGGVWNVFEPQTPGPHRIRVQGLGRGLAPDLSVVTPVEKYLIEIWPEPDLRPFETTLDDGRGR